MTVQNNSKIRLLDGFLIIIIILIALYGMINKNAKSPGITYSCYYNVSREGEHFVQEHTLTYQIAGTFISNDGSKEYVSGDGSFRLTRRNQLLKFVKHPPENGEFKSLSVFLDQETLKKFSLEYGITAEHKQSDKTVIDLKKNVLTKGYINSLLDYHENNNFFNKHFSYAFKKQFGEVHQKL